LAWPSSPGSHARDRRARASGRSRPRPSDPPRDMERLDGPRDGPRARRAPRGARGDPERAHPLLRAAPDRPLAGRTAWCTWRPARDSSGRTSAATCSGARPESGGWASGASVCDYCVHTARATSAWNAASSARPRCAESALAWSCGTARGTSAATCPGAAEPLRLGEELADGDQPGDPPHGAPDCACRAAVICSDRPDRQAKVTGAPRLDTAGRHLLGEPTLRHPDGGDGQQARLHCN
jgi:hypothetical protein